MLVRACSSSHGVWIFIAVYPGSFVFFVSAEILTRPETNSGERLKPFSLLPFVTIADCQVGKTSLRLDGDSELRASRNVRLLADLLLLVSDLHAWVKAKISPKNILQGDFQRRRLEAYVK